MTRIPLLSPHPSRLLHFTTRRLLVRVGVVYPHLRGRCPAPSLQAQRLWGASIIEIRLDVI